MDEEYFIIFFVVAIILFIISLMVFLIEPQFLRIMNKHVAYGGSSNVTSALREYFSGGGGTAAADNAVPKVEFPFKNCLDQSLQKLPIIAISAPFRTDEHLYLYETYQKQGLQFLGVSSYLNFPNRITNKYEDRYSDIHGFNYCEMVKAWLYCFRDVPPAVLSAGLPNKLITEADLKNPDDYPENKTPIEKREYDFLYLCLDDDAEKCTDGWQSENRNWELCKKCLVVMCRDFGLRGVIVGRTNCKFTELCEGSIKQFPFLPFDKFQELLQKCRFLFLPNVFDASPRVLSEALLYNLPVLCNEKILGGWHNVVEGVTGEFFSDENDVGNGIDKIMKNLKNYKTREWYCSNRGVLHSGIQLRDFLLECKFDNIPISTKWVTIM